MSKQSWKEDWKEQKKMVKTWSYAVHYIIPPTEDLVKEGMRLPIQITVIPRPRNSSLPEEFYKTLPKSAIILKYFCIGEIKN